MKDYGALLKQLRASRKISIRKLAKLCGYSSSYISNMEIGKRSKPRPHFLEVIAEPLKVPYEQLMIDFDYIRTPNEIVVDLMDRLDPKNKKPIELSSPDQYNFFYEGKPVHPKLMQVLSDHVFNLLQLYPFEDERQKVKTDD